MLGGVGLIAFTLGKTTACGEERREMYKIGGSFLTVRNGLIRMVGWVEEWWHRKDFCLNLEVKVSPFI